MDDWINSKEPILGCNTLHLKIKSLFVRLYWKKKPKMTLPILHFGVQIICQATQKQADGCFGELRHKWRGMCRRFAISQIFSIKKMLSLYQMKWKNMLKYEIWKSATHLHSFVSHLSSCTIPMFLSVIVFEMNYEMQLIFIPFSFADSVSEIITHHFSLFCLFPICSEGKLWDCREEDMLLMMTNFVWYWGSFNVLK